MKKGGTFSVSQTDVGPGHREMTALDVQMKGRVLFFKTIGLQEKEIRTDYQRIPDDTTLQQAVELLKKNTTSSAGPPQQKRLQTGNVHGSTDLCRREGIRVFDGGSSPCIYLLAGALPTKSLGSEDPGYSIPLRLGGSGEGFDECAGAARNEHGLCGARSPKPARKRLDSRMRVRRPSICCGIGG